VSSDVSEFRLSPQEDWIFGVKMRGSTLSFGPSGSEVALASVACGLMIFIGAVMAFGMSSGSTINGYPVENPTAMLVLGIAIIAYAAAFLISSLGVGVRADETGLTLRRLWSRRHVPWNGVAALRAHETVPHRWALFSSPNSLTFQMRTVSSWSIGVVEQLDGTVLRLPGFNAAARTDGLSLGLPTATELKVQALGRYMTCIAGRQNPLQSGAPAQLEDAHPSPWMIVGYLGAAVALWLLVSWAAGTLVSPVLLIVGIAINGYRFAQRQRAG
jgi:hypothetical protein